MEPNAAEANSLRVCKLIVYVFGKLKLQVHPWISKGATNPYGMPHRLDEAVRLLCATCKKLSKRQQDEIVYNGRIPMARDLAAWWEEHQKADRVRLAAERAAKNKRALVKQARAKLTREELAALTES